MTKAVKEQVAMGIDAGGPGVRRHLTGAPAPDFEVEDNEATRPGAPSSALVPSSDVLCSQRHFPNRYAVCPGRR